MTFQSSSIVCFVDCYILFVLDGLKHCVFVRMMDVFNIFECPLHLLKAQAKDKALTHEKALVNRPCDSPCVCLFLCLLLYSV